MSARQRFDPANKSSHWEVSALSSDTVFVPDHSNPLHRSQNRNTATSVTAEGVHTPLNLTGLKRTPARSASTLPESNRSKQTTRGRSSIESYIAAPIPSAPLNGSFLSQLPDSNQSSASFKTPAPPEDAHTSSLRGGKGNTSVTFDRLVTGSSDNRLEISALSHETRINPNLGVSLARRVPVESDEEEESHESRVKRARLAKDSDDSGFVDVTDHDEYPSHESHSGDWSGQNWGCHPDLPTQNHSSRRQSTQKKDAVQKPVTTDVLGDFIHHDVGTAVTKFNDRYEAARARWIGCTAEEWIAGGQEIKDKFSNLLNLVQEHMNSKIDMYTNFEKIVSARKINLKSRDQSLNDFKEKIINDSQMVGNMEI